MINALFDFGETTYPCFSRRCKPSNFPTLLFFKTFTLFTTAVSIIIRILLTTLHVPYAFRISHTISSRIPESNYNHSHNVFPFEGSLLFFLLTVYPFIHLSIYLIPFSHSLHSYWAIVEPRFQEPLHDKVHSRTNDIITPIQSYSKMNGTGPRYNEILVITNTTQKPKRTIYPEITNKC